jgi:3-oxoacyl-[acyl-carrier protein] reductase
VNVSPGGDLQGAVVVVTGAGQGLGRAYAHAFGRQGARVAVTDLNEDNAVRVAGEVTAAGGSAAGIAVDVSDPDSVAAMVERATTELGAPRVLVNNAAIFSTLQMRPFTEIPVDEWDRVMAVNVKGAFLCSRAVLPAMRDAGYGKIVIISSATIFIGRPNYLHYVTSKAALIGMTRAMANEVGPAGIRVNAVTPGATTTEIERATVTPAQREAMIQSTALRRGQVPDDLVGVVLFLASSASDFITGQTLNVDGGIAFH